MVLGASGVTGFTSSGFGFKKENENGGLEFVDGEAGGLGGRAGFRGALGRNDFGAVGTAFNFGATGGIVTGLLTAGDGVNELFGVLTFILRLNLGSGGFISALGSCAVRSSV